MTRLFYPFCLAPLLLAGCGDAEVLSPAATATGGGDAETAQDDGGASEAEAEAERTAMAGTGWLAIGEDGSVYTTYFDADGTYRDFANGAFLQQGAWRRREDGQLCFMPEAADRLGACWDTQGMEDDGTMRALDADGRAIELRRVNYLPPETGDADGSAITDDADEADES
ncbi:MAG: hypothetical protein RIB52_09730 [Erythrobacter sp.]|uniref:hypothetical protein n=1 Tax=Erythrobacter sp. TaxID=1042 RepID=UPI0032EB3802